MPRRSRTVQRSISKQRRAWRLLLTFAALLAAQACAPESRAVSGAEPTVEQPAAGPPPAAALQPVVRRFRADTLYHDDPPNQVQPGSAADVEPEDQPPSPLGGPPAPSTEALERQARFEAALEQQEPLWSGLPARERELRRDALKRSIIPEE